MIAHFFDYETELEFEYADCDSYENEIGELYSYTENPEFNVNKTSFEEFLQSTGHSSWKSLDEEAKTILVDNLLESVTNKDKREKAVECLLYLVQGVFGECENNNEQEASCRNNCYLIYKNGGFAVVQQLLVIEISNATQQTTSTEKRTNVISMEDSALFRRILSILYTIIETLRRSHPSDTDDLQKLRTDFIEELRQNLNDKEKSLIVILFTMVFKFCSLTCATFPMKKVLLLIWKIILTCLGGFKCLHEKKIELRKKANLKILDEDPIEIVNKMTASAPPTSASDLLEMGQTENRQRRKKMLTGENDDNNQISSRNQNASSVLVDNSKGIFEEEKVTSIDDKPSTNGSESNIEAAIPPGAMTPIPQKSKLETDVGTVAAKLFEIKKEYQEGLQQKYRINVPAGLPWIPKSCDRELESFLTVVRRKFIGYSYKGDSTSVAGLPRPTQESILILKKHLYTSLSKLQIEQEEQLTKYPFTLGKKEIIEDSPTERLYQALLLNLPKYIIALLQILLAAAPSYKKQSDSNSINILEDVLPKEVPSTHADSLQLGIDINRHREIIIKSISAIILLLLKHFKLSHIYQFEYTGQHLVFANCIPLILKFLSQGIVPFVTTKNTIPCIEFPSCVIGDEPSLSADSLKNLDSNNNNACWRNLFSSINLLRILNKLVKWKHSRTMMLVVFKSSPILKNALKIRQAMFQFYVLKLLKTQTKYLGRTWRKNNMKTISDIFQKVRHHLNDDWAFGNEIDTQPWDFQQEEFILRSNVERFNIRRYRTTGHNGNSSFNKTRCEDDYEPVNNDLKSLLSEEVELPNDFQNVYTSWLEREVYDTKTNWEELLDLSI